MQCEKSMARTLVLYKSEGKNPTKMPRQKGMLVNLGLNFLKLKPIFEIMYDLPILQFLCDAVNVHKECIATLSSN